MEKFQSWRYSALTLLMIWLIAFVLPVGNRGLWSPDEPRYTQVAWEMASADSWILPLLNQETYAEKPPLFFWLIILTAHVSGFETASRYVSALFALGTILLVYRIGQENADQKTGWLSGLILMTLGLYPSLIGTGNIDITLTFFTTLSVYWYLRMLDTHAQIEMIPAWLSTGMAILLKGPVGLLLPWLTFIGWTLWERCHRRRLPALHLLWGPLLALSTAALWIIPACIYGGPEYTQSILFRQNVGRAVSSFSHQQPFYYFFIHFPILALPWFPIFCEAIPGAKQFNRNNDRKEMFHVLWFLVIFVFFSLISGKRGRYLIPLFPVFSLMMAHAIHRMDVSKKQSKMIPLTLSLLLAVTALISLAPIFAPYMKSRLADYGYADFSPIHWRSVLTGCLGIVGVWITRKGFLLFRSTGLFESAEMIGLSMIILILIANIYYIPALDAVKSARPLAETIRAIVPPDGSMAYYLKRSDAGLNFYLNRLQLPEISKQELPQSVQYDLIISRKADFKRIDPAVRDDLHILHSQKIGNQEYILFKLLKPVAD